MPDDPNDKPLYMISPCLCCPECGYGDLDKNPYPVDGLDFEGVMEVNCWNCGATWLERHWNDDEDDAC